MFDSPALGRLSLAETVQYFGSLRGRVGNGPGLSGKAMGSRSSRSTSTRLTLDRGVKPPKTGLDSYRVKHCPGLYLLVSATGHKSWKVMYRVNGKLVKETHPTFGPAEDAVRWARELKDKARTGVNPVAERREAADRAAANTVAAAVERWLAQCERGPEAKDRRRVPPDPRARRTAALGDRERELGERGAAGNVVDLPMRVATA